jgi:hypothetical protein
MPLHHGERDAMEGTDPVILKRFGCVILVLLGLLVLSHRQGGQDPWTAVPKKVKQLEHRFKDTLAEYREIPPLEWSHSQPYIVGKALPICEKGQAIGLISAHGPDPFVYDALPSKLRPSGSKQVRALILTYWGENVAGQYGAGPAGSVSSEVVRIVVVDPKRKLVTADQTLSGPPPPEQGNVMQGAYMKVSPDVIRQFLESLPIRDGQ